MHQLRKYFKHHYSIPQIVRWAAFNLLLGLLYFGMAKFGLMFAYVKGAVTPVWPASGLALAALVLFGLRMWPGVLLGTLAANLSIQTPLAATIGIALGNTLEPLTAALLLKYLDFNPRLNRLRDVILLAGLATAVGPAVSALMGVTTLRLVGWVEGQVYWAAWWTWWVGDAMGILVFGPALLTWGQKLPRRPPLKRVFISVILITCLIGISLAVSQQSGSRADFNPPLILIIFPFLVWSALYFEQRGAASALLITEVIIVWNTVRGLGPFASASMQQSLGSLIIFLVVTSSTILILSAVLSERKQAQKEQKRLLGRQRQQARQLGEVMGSVPDGVLLLDRQMSVQTANPAAKDFLKIITGEEYPDQILRFGDISLQDLLTPPPVGRWHEINAGEHIFEAIARPLSGGSERKPDQRWVMVLRDVTKARQVQESTQQQERLAAVGQLAAGIAHDFNNILAVIQLYTDISLQSSKLDERLREQMQLINQQAERAARLIQQILDFSRRAVLERHFIDLLPFLKEQTRLMQRTLPENIHIQLDYQPGEYLINADPTRIQQAIMNLAINARDAMPGGGVLRLGVALVENEPGRTCPSCHREMPGEWVRISFSDNGDGIPEDVIPHIFEPFFTTKGPQGGTGLGLSQVYGIVIQHGGHMDVHSQHKNGSTFVLHLPAYTTKEQPPASTSDRPRRGAGQAILVVEDEDATRQALVESLAALGYRSLAVENGGQALELLDGKGQAIDLILSDVIMPGMDGIKLFRSLQQRPGAPPVVLMTGHPLETELDQLLDEGLGAWLPKPSTLSKLAQVVAEALNK